MLIISKNIDDNENKSTFKFFFPPANFIELSIIVINFVCFPHFTQTLLLQYKFIIRNIINRRIENLKEKI